MVVGGEGVHRSNFKKTKTQPECNTRVKGEKSVKKTIENCESAELTLRPGLQTCWTRWAPLVLPFPLFSSLPPSPPSSFKTTLSISLFFEPVGEGESGRLAATSTRGGTEGEARGPSASSGSKRGTSPRRCQQPATAAMGNLP